MGGSRRDTAALAQRLLAEEAGCSRKDWGGRLPIALVYPNSYYVGMSSLGYQTVYRLLNSLPDVVCERFFLNLGRGNAVQPPTSLESQRPLDDFPVVAFSISFELDYIHLVRILRVAGIPPLSAQRAARPLVIAGGAAASANPMPLSPLVDGVFIGELEEATTALVDALWKAAMSAKPLEELAGAPGMWVPALGSGQRVRRAWVRSLDPWPTATCIWTKNTELGGMHLVEMARGCPHLCRFCLAAHIYRPYRQRTAEAVLALAEAGIERRLTIGLLAPSLADCRALITVLEDLAKRGARFSLSSLRPDRVTRELLGLVVAGGGRSLTIAPETGCERLRKKLGKRFDNEALLAAASLARQAGLQELKLYFMIGLPGEDEEAIKQTADLLRSMRQTFRRRLVVNVAPFVPKPHTPWQWAAMCPQHELRRRLTLLRQLLAGTGVELRVEDIEWAQLQAIFARGDQKVGEALARIGNPSKRSVRQALTAAGIDFDEALRARRPGEPLPWEVVDAGLPRSYLEKGLPSSAQELDGPLQDKL